VTERRVVYVTTVDSSLRFLFLPQLAYLQRLGYRVSAVCAESGWSAEIRAAGIEVHHAALRRNVSPLADLAALAQLTAYYHQVRPHIVHTHTPKANLLGRLAARWSGVPIILGTEHGFYFYGMSGWRRAFYVALARLGASCSDAVFLINREDVATALASGICRSEQIIFQEGGVGVDLDRYSPGADTLAAKTALGIPAQAPVVGMVGRLAPEKGHADYFRAAVLVRKHLPQARFLVVGPAEPQCVAELRALAASLGLEEAVVFTGERVDLPPVYAAMDVVCLPSHREGLPGVLMEAAAMAKPVVATNIRGCRDVVTDGVTGLLVPPHDPEALARALLQVLRDADLARRMGQAARVRAETVYDQRRVFAQVEGEYRRRLQQKGLWCE